MTVGRNERFEVSIRNDVSYEDPYMDVELVTRFESPTGRVRMFWGFYDGNHTWKLRWMPRELGTWRYEAWFASNGPAAPNSVAPDSPSMPDAVPKRDVAANAEAATNPTAAGTFECVESDTPGIIAPYRVNPTWFSMGEAQPIMLRSIHVGDRFFASNWSQAERTRFLDWLVDHGYNTLSVGSFLLNRDAAGRGRGWQTPRLWPPDAREYRAAEEILGELERRRIIVFPFAGFFGRDAWLPTSLRSRVAYVKYVSARFGPFWNLLYNVAGPEPLLRSNPFMTKGDVDTVAHLIRRFDPFGHMMTVHNETGPDVFAYDDYIDFVTLQGPKTVDRAALAGGLKRQRRARLPLYAQETLWPGNHVGHPAYTLDDIVRNAIVMLFCGASINFADCDGNSSSGFTGSLDPSDAHEGWHAAMRRVWGLAEELRLWELSPIPSAPISPAHAAASPQHGYWMGNGTNRLLIYVDGPTHSAPAPVDAVPSGARGAATPDESTAAGSNAAGSLASGSGSGRRLDAGEDRDLPGVLAAGSWSGVWINAGDPGNRRRVEVVRGTEGLAAPDERGWILSVDRTVG